MRAAIAVTALLLCPACILDATVEYKYVEHEQKHFATSGTPDVALKTFDGAIEVRPWDKSEVDVTIEKRGPSQESLKDLVVEATQDGNRVTVEVRSKHPGGIHFGLSPNAKLIVSLPARSNVVARSGDGSIDIERVTGRVELNSGDGSIRARDLTGDVNVHTGDGSVALEGRFAALKATTGDGSVRIHVAEGSSPTDDWIVTTGDGSITLEIPDGFNGDLDAHTGDGRVRAENVTVSSVVGEMRRNALKGRLGAGGKLLKLRTGDGSITLRRS